MYIFLRLLFVILFYSCLEKLNWKLSPQIYGRKLFLVLCFFFFLYYWWFSDPKSNIFSFIVILNLFFISVKHSVNKKREFTFLLVGLWLTELILYAYTSHVWEKELEWKITWLWIPSLAKRWREEVEVKNLFLIRVWENCEISVSNQQYNTEQL